jgi:hypothetical protein
VNGFTWCDPTAVVRAAVSVALTDTDVQPGALTVKVAAPLPELFAATSTGCGRFQLLELSVIELPEVMLSPVLPVSATVTAIDAEGASFSDTPNTPVVPCETSKLDGLASRSRPDPQLPVGVLVGDGDEVGDEVGDGDDVGLGDVVGVGEADVGLGDADGDGDALTGVPVQVTVVGAVFVPL